MISLWAYCQQNTIDGHIHLFDKDGCIVVPNMKCIGFCDIEPKYLSQYQNTIPYYEDFISKKYDNVYLLATSADPQNMIDIHKKWPDTIKGFGELKCYKEWKGEKLNLDKLSKYWSLCKYAAEYNLPIFIHFSLYDDYTVGRFSKLLNKFPSVKLVLCHCGMDKETNNDFCYHSVMKLMNDYPNLWVDVTWEALDYFSDNPLKLTNMDRGRIILGSDMSRKSMNEENYKKEWDKVHNLDSFIKSDKNIKKLFNL